MKRTAIVIVVLVALLLGTNLFWLYTVMDGAVASAHQRQAYEDARSTAHQTLAVLTEVAGGTATRQGVIDAAVRAHPGTEPFEKDGFVWVGSVGLRFTEDGRLAEVVPSVDPL